MVAARFNDRFPPARPIHTPPIYRLAERVRPSSDQHPVVPPSAEDVRVQAWLTERLAVLHYERHGLWPRLRRLFGGNRRVVQDVTTTRQVR